LPTRSSAWRWSGTPSDLQALCFPYANPCIFNASAAQMFDAISVRNRTKNWLDPMARERARRSTSARFNINGWRLAPGRPGL
jgi:hypothetical protein